MRKRILAVAFVLHILMLSCAKDEDSLPAADSVPAHESIFFADDYTGDALGADITDVFRTPTTGPLSSAAWYEPRGPGRALVTSRLDGQAAEVQVPRDSSLDYIGYLGQSTDHMVLLLTWDIEVSSVNGGGGMFFVRFPTFPSSMQVLFGFLDDGRIIRFAGEPGMDTLVEVGSFQAGIRYRVCFIYDLNSDTYSVYFDGAWIVDHEPIPSHFETEAIEKFGFDVNQLMGLPDNPAHGNTYYVDNIRCGPLAGTH